jgi:hypothetical protein
LHDQIQKVRNSFPSNMTVVMAKLMQLNTYLYRRAPKKGRIDTNCAAVKTDILWVLQRWWPHLVAGIEATDLAQKTAAKVETECLLEQGYTVATLPPSTWHPLQNLMMLISRQTSVCKPLMQQVQRQDGAKPRGYTEVHAMSTRAPRSGGGRQAGPDFAPKKQQYRSAGYASVASMDGQVGSARADFPRSPRGTFVPRGSGQSRGFGRPQGGARQRDGFPAARPQTRPPDRKPRGGTFNRGPARGSRGAGNANNVTRSGCQNCARPNHQWRDCRKYQGEAPGQQRCRKCNGSHAQACRESNPVNAMHVAGSQ